MKLMMICGKSNTRQTKEAEALAKKTLKCEVARVAYGTNEANLLLRKASGHYGNRNATGLPRFVLLNNDDNCVWAAAKPNARNIKRTSVKFDLNTTPTAQSAPEAPQDAEASGDALDTTANGGTVLNVDEAVDRGESDAPLGTQGADEKPKARIVALLADDPNNCHNTLRALEFYSMRPAAGAEMLEFGTDEAREVEPILYAFLGHEEKRRPLVATLVGNEATRVDVEPSDDVLQEGLVHFLTTKVKLVSNLESAESLQSAPTNEGAPAQSATA